MREREFQSWTPFQKAAVEEDGHLYIEGYAATFGEVDYHGEILSPNAFDDTLEEYLKNPVVLADHTRKTSHAIGRVVKHAIDNQGLWVRVKVSNAKDEFTSMIRDKIREGIITGFSIGGKMLYHQGTPIIQRVRLEEISVTPSPAIKGAQFGVVMKKVAEEIRREADGEKAANGAMDLPLADRSVEWDGDAAVKELRRWASSDGSGDKDKMDWAKYRRAFFWYDEKDPENFGSYKFPFARPINGRLMAIPRAIFAAASILQGGRGGTNLPAEAQEAIKRKVEAYYRKMGETPPWKEGKKSEEEKPEIPSFRDLLLEVYKIKDEVIRDAWKRANGI